MSDILKRRGEELSFNTELKKKRCQMQSHMPFANDAPPPKEVPQEKGRADTGGETPEVQSKPKVSW